MGTLAWIAVAIVLSGSGAGYGSGMGGYGHSAGGSPGVAVGLESLGSYTSYGEEAASTPLGSTLQGLGQMVRSFAQYELAASAAAINFSQAERMQMENYRTWTQTYFDVRRMNRQLRTAERGPRPPMEDLVRYAHMGRPQRLSPSQLDIVSGELNWPLMLRTERLAPYRTELETIFSHRAVAGALGPEQYMRAISLADLMQGILKSHIRELPPDDYLVAQHFLESVAFEAKFPSS